MRANTMAAAGHSITAAKRALIDRVHHGDFLELAEALDGLEFDLVIADPPYNIGKDFGNDSDSRALADYLEWTDRWLSVCLSLLKPNGVIYVYGFPEILAHVAVRYPLEKQRWLVWHYTNKTVPGSKFWQRSHESILCLWTSDRRPPLRVDQIREAYTEQYKKCIGKPRRETKCRYNTKGRGSTYNGHAEGALPRDVLKVPALAGGAGRSERWFLCRDCDRLYPPEYLAEHDGHDVLKHPTQKPMELSRRLLQSCIEGTEGRVLIPFAGSGSECVVAKTMGIEFFGSEVNREYVRFAESWLKHVDDSERPDRSPRSAKSAKAPALPRVAASLSCKSG